MKDIPDNYYDAIIIRTVIHHLAEILREKVNRMCLRLYVIVNEF